MINERKASKCRRRICIRTHSVVILGHCRGGCKTGPIKPERREKLNDFSRRTSVKESPTATTTTTSARQTESNVFLVVGKAKNSKGYIITYLFLARLAMLIIIQKSFGRTNGYYDVLCAILNARGQRYNDKKKLSP